VLVVAGMAVLGDRTGETSDPAPAPTRSPDAHFQGAPVYWSPSPPEEAALPLMTEGRPPLPEEIDLSAEATPVEDDPIDHALAALAVVGDATVEQLLLVAPDNTYRTVDLSAVGPHPSGSYGVAPAIHDSMLSPTGEYLMFPQVGSVLVFRIETGVWRRIDTGRTDTTYATWGNGREISLRSQAYGGAGPNWDVVTADVAGRSAGDASLSYVDLGSSQRYGRYHYNVDATLQSWGSGARMPVPDGTPDNPEMLVVTTDADTILTMTGSPDGDDRWLQCCPAIGALDDDVALYESRSSTPRIIAWTIGTHRFQVVSTITGFTPGEQSYVASFPEL
jgi:hypothetical protein